MLEFTTDKMTLAGALADVKPFLARDADTIFGCCLIECSEEKTTITGMDHNTGISLTTDAEVMGEGKIAVPLRNISEFVKKLPNGYITLQQESERTLGIRANGITSHFALMNETEYPAIPQTREAMACIPARELLPMISGTVFAAARTYDRPSLTGAYLEWDKKCISLTATDGFRLSTARRNLPGPEEINCIIPAGILERLRRLWREDSGDVFLWANGQKVQFVCGNMMIWGAALDGPYIDYSGFFRGDYPVSAGCEREELMGALKLAMTVTPSPCVVKAEIAEGTIRISAKDSGADVTQDIRAHLAEGQITVHLNAQFLLDALSGISEEKILMQFSSERSPLVLSGGPEAKHLVLPVMTHG